MHSKESTTLSIKCDGIGGVFLLHHGLAFQCSSMIVTGTGMCAIIWFDCLFGFNVAFKHLKSYRDGACLKQWYFDQCAPTQECHADDTGHDTSPRHSIQTQDRPVAVLSNDVERHTGIHSYPF